MNIAKSRYVFIGDTPSRPFTTINNVIRKRRVRNLAMSNPIYAVNGNSVDIKEANKVINHELSNPQFIMDKRNVQEIFTELDDIRTLARPVQYDAGITYDIKFDAPDTLEKRIIDGNKNFINARDKFLLGGAEEKQTQTMSDILGKLKEEKHFELIARRNARGNARR